MTISIDSAHPIFISEAYQKDIIAFSLIEVVKAFAKLPLPEMKFSIDKIIQK